MYDDIKDKTGAYEQEAAQDIEDAKKSLAEPGQPIPWEELRDQLELERLDYFSVYAS